MAIRTTGTFEPVGTFPVVDSANVSNVCTDSEAAAIRAGATRAYPTCASVRADTSASTNNPYIYVLDRGAFSWTTDTGTDTGNELTDYIAGTGGGFAFQSIL